MKKEFKSAAQIYSQEVKAFKPLSPDELTALFISLETARNQMIEGICESPVTLQTISDWRDGLEKGTVHALDIGYRRAADSDGSEEVIEDDADAAEDSATEDAQDDTVPAGSYWISKSQCINAFDRILAISANKDFSQVKPALQEMFRTMRFKMIAIDKLADNITQNGHAGQGDGLSVNAFKQTASKIKNGAREWAKARDAIFNANLGLVLYFANRYRNYGLQFDDLVQEGNMGMMTAIERFDHRLGKPFSSYAGLWIEQTMGMAPSKQATTIRIPWGQIHIIKKLERASDEMSIKNGRAPTAEEIAEELGTSPEKVRDLQQIVKEPVSLQNLIGDEEDTYIGDLIEDKDTPSSFDVLAEVHLRKSMTEILSRLTPREESILRMHYGIGEDREYTLGEIGDILNNITRERVRQIKDQAIGKLNNSPDARKLFKLLNS